MVRFQSIALVMMLAQSSSSDEIVRNEELHERRLQTYQPIAGYYPFDLVTDHAAVDLDQATIMEQLALGTDTSYEVAKAIYQEGGHSKAYAVVSLGSATSKAFDKGTDVTGTAVDGSQVTGELSSSASAGSTSVKIKYATSDTKPHVGCMVGPLSEIGEEFTDGCLAPSGQVTIGDDTFDYTYNVLADNKAGRTLAGFSTAAKAKMYECDGGCPMRQFMRYYDYYGEFDYANQLVLAAFNEEKTMFANGNADFSDVPLVVREQAIKKGIPYMNVYMYVLRELLTADAKCVPDCLDCSGRAMKHWDEGWAFYAGSLEGVDGSGSGKLLYALADKRCKDFGTCGRNNDAVEGTSWVNLEILDLYNNGLQYLYLGLCDLVNDIQVLIVNHMKIPLIQGALKYAYKVGELGDDSDKSKAEAAAFSHAILPEIAECNEKDAKTIYENIGYNAKKTDFKKVYGAFKKNFDCLKVECEEIGGLVNSDTGDYYKGFAPCQ